MKVTFVHHSCFVVDLERKTLVFDYFDKEKINGYHFTGELPEFERNKPVYFFASHRHQDHFDLNILKMADQNPQFRYVLSKDIRLGANYLRRNGIPLAIREKITFVAPDKSCRLSDLQIETLRSTDEGVAFYIETEGVSIFHAGDLHNWYFEGAGGLVNGKMENGFKAALRRLEEKHINLAFVVLDGRLGIHKYRGLDYFMQHISADYVFPMHMWQEYNLIGEYKKRCMNAQYTERIADITHENQIFDIAPPSKEVEKTRGVFYNNKIYEKTGVEGGSI